MKVAFDASSTAFEKKTGTGVYSEELIKAYQKKFEGDEVTHTYRMSRAVKGSRFFLERSKNSKVNLILDPWTFFKGFRYDIFHGLNARLPLLSKTKRVVTIHDLFSIFGNFSEEKFKSDQKNKIIQTLKRAHHVITPSKYVKNQLVEKLGWSENKVSVVGEGVRDVYLQKADVQMEKEKIKDKFNIQKPFFLFVGTLEKRKNIIGLLKAFKKFDNKSPDTHELVLIGGEGFGFEEIKKTISDLQLDAKIKRLGFMDEQWLASFFRVCEAFIFLSFEEGYGIPVIEAMSCAVPVISSNSTSLPEVGGGHSFLVSPHDTDGAAEIMLHILKKSPQIIEKIKEAQNYAHRLTWTKVAEDTRQIYLNLVQNP